MKIVQGQVRGLSQGGEDTPSDEIALGGFTPGTKAHVMMTGWSVKFTFGDHPILEMGFWLQQAVLGKWLWCQEVAVQPDGTIKARYIGFAGSENRDNPFTFLVNYAVVGE